MWFYEADNKFKNTFLSLSQKKYLTIYDMYITNITKLNVTHL